MLRHVPFIVILGCGALLAATRLAADLLGWQDGLAPPGAMAIKRHTPVEVYGYRRA